MTRPNRDGTVRLSIRVPADLYAVACEYAERNEMSMEDLALTTFFACRIVKEAAARPHLASSKFFNS